jgi:hypothetical protein
VFHGDNGGQKEPGLVEVVTITHRGGVSSAHSWKQPAFLNESLLKRFHVLTCV